MEFTRFKTTIAAPKPEVRFSAASADEIAKGGPFDAGKGRNLQPGELLGDGVESNGVKYAATFEGIVQIALEACDAGRCVNCRDNSRVRFLLKVSGEHGTKKWCVPCLVERYAVDPAAK